jgi:hypothetical protein
MVVVRAGISIDPHDAHLTIVSDPLPSILQGVPLRIRDVRINIDRPGFVINPTSCAESAVGGAITPSTGGAVPVSARFQVGDCASLPVAPKFKLATSRAHKQKSHPQVKVTLTQTAGQANLKNVQVKLPKSLGVAVSSITVCQPAQLDAGACPAASQVGTARAVSPLLPLPLSGPVFIVGSGSGLPALAVRLSGNGVNINVDAQTKLTKAGQVINTFPAVPDVALSSFVLTLHGGKTGLLTATKNLCTASKKAATNVLAQNGKRTTSSPTMKVGGCPKAKKKTKKKSHKH